MQIYLARNNQQAGPYTVEQLNQMLASQHVLLTDLIWHEGMSEWKTLGELTQGQLSYYPVGYQNTESVASPTPFGGTTRTTKTNVITSANELAPISKRVFAKFIDVLLWLPVLIIPFAMLSTAQRIEMAQLQQQYLTFISQNQIEQTNQLFTQMLGIFPQSAWITTVFYIIAMLVVQAMLLHKIGQSVGKKVMEIQIVDAESKQMVTGYRSFFMRTLVFLPLHIYFMPIITLIDAAFAYGKKRQALHDRLAKTVVVNKK